MVTDSYNGIDQSDSMFQIVQVANYQRLIIAKINHRHLNQPIRRKDQETTVIGMLPSNRSGSQIVTAYSNQINHVSLASTNQIAAFKMIQPDLEVSLHEHVIAYRYHVITSRDGKTPSR